MIKLQIFFGHLSLSRVPSLLEKVKDALWLLTENVCSVFTFDPLHNFYLGFPTLLKN